MAPQALGDSAPQMWEKQWQQAAPAKGATPAPSCRGELAPKHGANPATAPSGQHLPPSPGPPGASLHPGEEERRSRAVRKLIGSSNKSLLEAQRDSNRLLSPGQTWRLRGFPPGRLAAPRGPQLSPLQQSCSPAVLSPEPGPRGHRASRAHLPGKAVSTLLCLCPGPAGGPASLRPVSPSDG